MRTTLGDISNSRLPMVLGLCSGDLPRLSSYLNESTQVLMGVAGETGWADGWAKLLFNVSCANPYITLPYGYARLVNIALCRAGMPIFTSFYEVLEAGIGLQTPCQGRYGCGIQGLFERDSVVTMVDLTPTNQLIRCYLTDARDIGKRIIFTGARDSNNLGIYSTDIQNQIDGFPLVLNQPFVTSAFVVTAFSGVQKDVTYGDVIVSQVDASTGAEVQLARYTPNETRPTYRRYYLQGFCPTDPQNVNRTRPVTAFAKYEYRPVSEPTDFLIIGNIPALKAQCESIRFSEIDSPQSQAMALLKHRQAVKLLNQELVHYHSEKPAINVALQGTASLSRAGIGTVW